MEPHFRSLVEQAQTGNVDAQLAAANAFLEAKIYPEAISWFQAAIESSDSVPAMLALANLHFQGAPPDVKKNYEAALMWYLKAARLGDPCAQFNVGTFYENGFSVETDKTAALKWYQLAADSGLAAGQHGMAMLLMYSYPELETELTEEQATRTAFELFQSASNQAHFPSYYELGRCFDKGKGTEHNVERAYNYLRLAADYQDPMGVFALGCLHCFPPYLDGVAAMELFQQSSVFGNSKGTNNVGYILEHGIVGVERDIPKALEWYRKAYDDGLDYALHGIADCSYALGDYKHAFQSYSELVAKGDINGYIGLGNCYFNGRGVERSEKLAVQAYMQLPEAELGSYAQTNLARCYLYGLGGLEQNVAKAVDMLRQGREANHPDAVYWLGRAYEAGFVSMVEGGGNPVAESKALSGGRSISPRTHIQLTSSTAPSLTEVSSKLGQMTLEPPADRSFLMAVLLYQDAALRFDHELSKSRLRELGQYDPLLFGESDDDDDGDEDGNGNDGDDEGTESRFNTSETTSTLHSESGDQ
ncbi:uncharacterized protein BJ171DRAFT_82654 [Polychytrium aggregatum]|uniref:uncharacterized protein n=1 Tax=Polychytrium aggregatum TaxID=110093 RepID=UPI0022FDE3B6|nr:uncharacterized protein BJ171DRAFT_82654 [Polychytrium aggregatum]KAI9205072.1 hypothetical protein BJ171DRAFT_82654 [Polychytrium aggregatum]